MASSYAGDTEQEGTDVALIGWRDYFTDPHLTALIAQAQENNRDLRTAILRVEEARAAYGIQRAEQFPTIGLQAGLDRSRTPADLNLTGKPLLGSQYQVGLGMASWEIDFWGRVRSLKDAALESYLATDAARRAATIGLSARNCLDNVTNIIEMKSTSSRSEEPVDLLESLRSAQLKRAQQLLREANLIQTVLSVSTDLFQAITNIRIQRLMVLLTLISIGIATWALIVHCNWDAGAAGGLF